MDHLTAADGAIGSHGDAVQDARRTFEALDGPMLDFSHQHLSEEGTR